MLRRVIFRLRRYRSKKNEQLAASSQLFIGEVSSEGFTIERLVGNYARQYRWNDLTDVMIDIPKLTLTFFTFKDRSFVVPKANHEGWYKLLHAIPEGYPSFDIKAIHNHLSQMTACKVCGGMAVYERVCRACETPVFSGDRQKARLYYTQKQLEYFAQHAGLAYIDLFADPLDGFSKSPDFEILVTEEEVHAFRAQENLT